MQFNPRTVIILQLTVFTVLDFPGSPVTSHELTMGKMKLMLKEIYEDGYEMKEERLAFKAYLMCRKQKK